MFVSYGSVIVRQVPIVNNVIVKFICIILERVNYTLSIDPVQSFRQVEVPNYINKCGIDQL